MATIVRDGWLTDVTGIPCFSMDAADAKDVPELPSGVPDGAAFLFAKVPVTRVDVVKALTRAGFYLVDTNVTLQHIASAPSDEASPAVVIEQAAASDHAAAQDIASNSFRYSRFHLDPGFPRALADRVKREWVRSYCERRRGSELLVARREGQVAGFLAVLTTSDDGRTAAVIDLVAVDRSAQGVGVGTALVRHFVREWRKRADVLRVGTQLANFPSLALYRRCGFSVVGAKYVLHAHLKNGRVL